MHFIRVLMSLICIHCSFLLSLESSESWVPTTLYIVRHGQTDWNVEKRIQGVSDIPLNDTGKSQVAALKSTLNPISFSFCYSSDLQRAVQTAHILLEEKSSVPVQLDSRLRERNFGSWEGCLSCEFDDALKQQGQVESDDAVRERVVACLHEIAEQHRGSRVLITTHGGAICRLIEAVFSIAIPGKIRVENAGLLTLKICNGKMHIEEMQGIHLLIDKM